MTNKHRAVERLKTVLIVLLACSAVFLAAQTLFPMRDQGLLSKLPSASSSPAEESTSSDLSGRFLRPAAFAVTWQDGRYGLLYHQEDSEAYTYLYSVLAEALAAADAPSAASSSAWQSALSRQSLYCEYSGSLPLDAFSFWLSGDKNTALSGYSFRALCVTAKELYFLSEDLSSAYVCSLSADLTASLNRFFTHFTPNGALFAYQDSRFVSLRSDTLLLPTTPLVPTLTGECPISASSSPSDSSYTPNDALFSALQQLSFHPQTNPLYAVGDGWAITDAGETLRVSADGTISYKRSDFDANRYLLEGAPLEWTKDLVESVLSPLAGSAHVYLQRVSTLGQTTTITYGYAFRGAKIDLSDDGWCAAFTFEGDAITSFTLRLRRYAVLEGGDVALLPQEQALAALGMDEAEENSARSLEIYYYDAGTGEAMKPFWAAKEADHGKQ